MNDFIVAPKSRIFIFDRVQTMRAGCHNSLRFYLVEYFHVCRGEAKENILASCAASGITRALLILSKYCEVDPCRVQNFCKCLGSLLGARIGCRGTANPPQNVGFGILFDGWDI